MLEEVGFTGFGFDLNLIFCRRSVAMNTQLVVLNVGQAVTPSLAAGEKMFILHSAGDSWGLIRDSEK